jgi:integrase
MARIKLEHVNGIKDRYGKVRYYFRRRGFKNMRLPGIPGSAEFNAAYADALATMATARLEIGAARAEPGSVGAAVAGYLNSGHFIGLAEGTRRGRRRVLEAFAGEHGDKRVASLQPVHIERMLAAKARTPGAALNFLIALRGLMYFAKMVGLRADDPTKDVRRPQRRSAGIYPWTEEDIARFEATHAPGTRERLALALLLYTAQRRGDVLRMGRQHVRNGLVEVRQQKTGTALAIPVHAELRAVLDATPLDQMTFLVTRFGRPFSPVGFSNWFKAACRKAGLPKPASVHGLRKAAARRLAEAGCTAPEIAAITGHASLREVQRYIASADQVRMARSAMRKVAEAGS